MSSKVIFSSGSKDQKHWVLNRSKAFFTSRTADHPPQSMSVKAGASAGPKVAEAPLPTSHPGPGGLSGGGLAWAFMDNCAAEIGEGVQIRPWSGKSTDTASPRLKG